MGVIGSGGEERQGTLRPGDLEILWPESDNHAEVTAPAVDVFQDECLAESSERGTDAKLMKIRHPMLIKAAGVGGAWLFRAWMGSIRLRYRYYGPNVDPRRPGLASRHIYAIWHENLFYPVHVFRKANMCYL